MEEVRGYFRLTNVTKDIMMFVWQKELSKSNAKRNKSFKRLNTHLTYSRIDFMNSN